MMSRRCNKSNRAARQAAGNCFWRLVAAGEPFRLLFPVGILVGIYGVLLWPLFYWKVSAIYPGLIHARIMIEGFLTAFVIGFLGTALPRLLEAPKMTGIEAVGFAAAVVGIVALHARGDGLWGDVLFFMTIGALIFVLGVRGLLFRRDFPPPGFVLVGAGLLCALFGAGVQVIGSVSATALPEWCFPLGKSLLYQGYLLFPVMGVGAFLLPRFFGLPSRQSLPESPILSAEWKRLAGFASACGSIVLAGFVLEAMGDGRWGNGLKAAGVLLYFQREVPVHRAGTGGGSLAMGVRVALFSIPSAYALMALWPERTGSSLHLLFISGFSLLTLVVASRVILGHSGQSARFSSRIWPVLFTTALVALAMLTRVSADWMPAIQMSHYAYAALSLVLGVVIWSATILPGVRRADAE